jgi:hypothetical protein
VIDPEIREDAPAADARMLRQFAGLWLAFFAGLALWHTYRAHYGRAILFGVLALAVGPRGLIVPDSIGPLFAALISLTRPIGVLMTRIVLFLLFYALFAPIAFCFRLMGRDALHRTRDARDTTYWKTRAQVSDPRRYFRQF